MMNAHCPSCDVFDRSPKSARPRFFNWMTILLVTAWVVLVAVIAEVSGPAIDAEGAGDPAAFVESLTR